MLRDAHAGELRAGDVGREVRLAGWVAHRRDHGRLIFIDLRDRSGVVQLVFDPSRVPDAHAAAEQVRPEFVLAVRGEVVARSPETVNPGLPSGDVEVRVASVSILNRSKTPPFEIEAAEAVDVDETLRLKYRYLDLRRAPMLANLELRHRAVQAARDYLNEQRFLEIETPELTKSSPEGARDFLVPSRLQPHRFYALPQSPQMFKQILMVAGMERYYQFARCFRDEDLRADRQPEHTQIDIETSFLGVPEIRELLEGLMNAIFAGAGEGPLPLPLPRLSYDEAMLRFGSDKPDLRYGLEIVELSDVFAGSAFKVFAAAVERGGVVRAIRAPGAAGMSRGEIDKLTDLAKAHGAGGMAYVYVEDGRSLRGPIVKFLSEGEQAAVVERTGAEPGDLVVFAADQAPVAAVVLGALRLALINALRPAPSARWALLWVEEFPLFEIGRGDRPAHLRPQPVQPADRGHDAAPGERPAGRPRRPVRPRAQRRRARVWLAAQPRRRHAARHPASARHERRAHRRGLRLVPRGARVRGAAARRHRPRFRPHPHAARRGRLHPRRHRLPQDVLRRRPHDRRPRRGHRRAAQGPARPARLSAGARPRGASPAPRRDPAHPSHAPLRARHKPECSSFLQGCRLVC